MSETSTEANQAAVLALFAKATGGRLKPSDLKKKLGTGSKLALTEEAADQTLASLIEEGLLAVSGGKKEGLHPRTSASYRLTDKGKHHLRPAKPDLSDEILRGQEAFILLQVFRASEQALTRSKLNEKLRTNAAKGQLEFDIKETPETVDYHLASLVEKGHLDEQRRGVSVGYTLNPEHGLQALASAQQHEGVTFTMSGKILNELIQAARGSAPSPQPEIPPEDEEEVSAPVATPRSSQIGSDAIVKYIEHLKADKYAGKGLVPIYEVRRLVAQHHGDDAASHPNFDPLLKRMRSDEELELIAISDNRNATQEQLDASIPGMNETIFYIVVE